MNDGFVAKEFIVGIKKNESNTIKCYLDISIRVLAIKILTLAGDFLANIIICIKINIFLESLFYMLFNGISFKFTQIIKVTQNDLNAE